MLNSPLHTVFGFALRLSWLLFACFKSNLIGFTHLVSSWWVFFSLSSSRLRFRRFLFSLFWHTLHVAFLLSYLDLHEEYSDIGKNSPRRAQVVEQHFLCVKAILYCSECMCSRLCIFRRYSSIVSIRSGNRTRGRRICRCMFL